MRSHAISTEPRALVARLHPDSPLPSRPAGTRPERIRLQKWTTIFKDHITLEDYEIHDNMGLELYYN